MIVRLMQVLGSFDTGFEEFEKHLISPDCVATDRARKLFAYFEQNFGRYNTTNLNPKKIFKAIYPKGRSYKSRMVSEPIRELTGLLDDFLPSFAAKVDPKLRQAIRRRLYHENHEELLFYGELEMPEKVPLHSLGSRKAQEQMNNCDDFYAFQPEEKSEKDLTTSLVNMRKLNRVSYEINELKACCTLINREAQYGHTLEADFRQKLLDFIDGLVYREVLLVNALALSAEFYLEPDVKKYEAFKAFFMINLDELPERFELLHMLINGLSYIAYPNGRLAEYFFLFSLGEKHDFLIQNKFIPPQLYLNVVSTAINLGKTEWSKKFKQKNIEHIGQNGANVIEVAEGYFAYSIGDYRKVVQQLRGAHYREVNLALRKYLLVLKSMYSLKGEDEFFDLPKAIKSFKDLLYRQFNKNVINEKVYQGYLNFALILREMARPKPKFSKLELSMKLEEIKDNLVEIGWLRLQLEKW